MAKKNSGVIRLPGPADEREHNPCGHTGDGNEEEVAKRFSPGGKKTAGWHRGGTNGERHGRRQGESGCDPGNLVTDGEKEIDEAEAEEGNVAQPGQAAAKTVVSSHPVFAMKEESDQGTGKHSEEHADPSDSEHIGNDRVTHKPGIGLVGLSGMGE